MQPGEHREHIENPAAAAALDDRNEFTGHLQGAEVVGFHLQPDVVHVSRQQVRPRRYARVVDYHVDVGRDLCCAADRFGIGDIELNRYHPGRVDRFRPSSASVDLGTARHQLLGEALAEPSVCAGDQRGDLAVVQGDRVHVHAFRLLFCTNRSTTPAWGYSRPCNAACSARGSATVTVSAEWSRRPMTRLILLWKWMHSPARGFVPNVRPSSANESRGPTAVHHR